MDASARILSRDHRSSYEESSDPDCSNRIQFVRLRNCDLHSIETRFILRGSRLFEYILFKKRNNEYCKRQDSFLLMRKNIHGIFKNGITLEKYYDRVSYHEIAFLVGKETIHFRN